MVVLGISRVAFLSRTTLFSVPGGDTTQIVQTAAALRQRGVEVDISTQLEPDLSRYDVVHLFNLMRPQEVYLQALNAKKQGKKVALSTIYGPYTEYDRKARKGPGRILANVLSHGQLEYVKVMARAVVNREMNRGTAAVASHGFTGLQRALVRMTDVFLPNSVSEMRRVHSDFPDARSKPFVIVPNAVDARLFDPDSVTVSPEVEKLRGCVLSVARIEGRKCQLELARAMKDADVPLVFVGRPAPNHRAYFEAVRREAGIRGVFLGQVEHDRLPELYKVASCHCLISWMETPGLSSLEAAAMGTNIVVTRKGDADEYFGDLAFYCEPDSPMSIRAAVDRARVAPLAASLREMVVERYSWERAADRTLEAYRAVLS
jgi:glycosyltransferase involved in cell wall biosynthesis